MSWSQSFNSNNGFRNNTVERVVSFLLLYFVWPSSSSPMSTFAASSNVTCRVCIANNIKLLNWQQVHLVSSGWEQFWKELLLMTDVLTTRVSSLMMMLLIFTENTGYLSLEHHQQMQSLDSEDDFRSGCQNVNNVSFQQLFFSELSSLGDHTRWATDTQGFKPFNTKFVRSDWSVVG